MKTSSGVDIERKLEKTNAEAVPEETEHAAEQQGVNTWRRLVQVMSSNPTRKSQI